MLDLSILQNGLFFTDQKFPSQVLNALRELPDVSPFLAENAMFITDSNDLEELISFIYGTHEFLQ